MKRTIITLFLLVLIRFLAIGYGRTGRIDLAWTQLNLELSSRGIDTSKVDGNIIDVDSSIGVRKISLGQIHDPYGTLSGCFLFAVDIGTTDVDSNGLVGVLRNGRILWMSEPFTGSPFGFSIYATLDLNKDSTVEIITEWVGDRHGESSQLWIHSWDGKQGKAINAVEHGASTISGSGFQFADFDKDGILEITATIQHYDMNEGGFIEEGEVVYKWNGKLYGLRDSTKRSKHQKAKKR